MNRRTSKLLDHVVNALLQAGDKPALPKGKPRQVFNHAKNVKRKLKRSWNSKPSNIRCGERLGIIRTLISMEAARG